MFWRLHRNAPTEVSPRRMTQLRSVAALEGWSTGRLPLVELPISLMEAPCPPPMDPPSGQVHRISPTAALVSYQSHFGSRWEFARRELTKLAPSGNPLFPGPIGEQLDRHAPMIYSAPEAIHAQIHVLRR
jgi:hypothetical protein